MSAISFRDESKFEGLADCLWVPEKMEEIVELVRDCRMAGKRLTVQGSLTGITGAGVPVMGCAVSMKKMNRIKFLDENGEMYVIAEAGVTAEQLQKAIRQYTNDQYFFPVLPTEKTATLGGIAACGASGIYSYSYGEFKDYVQEIAICNDQNEILIIEKCCPEFDEIFRSEGTRAIIISMKIMLLKKPARIWGILFQFPQNEAAVSFTEEILDAKDIIAIEYMDRNTINLIEHYKDSIDSISDFPDIEENTEALIYLELIGASEEELMMSAEELLEKCLAAGGDPDEAWAMCTEEEVDRLRDFRHASSECVNMEIGKVNRIDSRIHKLSLDVKRNLKERNALLQQYRSQLEKEGLRFCIFGHFGKGGPYVNLLPSDYEQYKKGTEVFHAWIKDAYKEGMDAFGEHGIGKIKRELFLECAPVEIVDQTIRLKKKWDKQGIFNPETMI